MEHIFHRQLCYSQQDEYVSLIGNGTNPILRLHKDIESLPPFGLSVTFLAGVGVSNILFRIFIANEALKRALS